jgi:hypothetical protein
MFKVHSRASLGFTVALALAVVVGLMAYLPVAAMAGTCENEADRAAQASSFLPECRAYELVSPPGATAYFGGNNGNDTAYDPPEKGQWGARAAERHSASDGGIAWFSYFPPPGFSGASMELLSTRDSSGWNTKDAIPQQSASSGAFLGCNGYTYFSADLTRGVLADGREQCAHNDPPLVENEPEGFENIFLHDFAAESYRLVNLTPPTEAPAEALFQDASTDMTHIVFSENARLTLSAPPGEDLYEWFAGRVHLVSILPDGTAAPGRLVGFVSEAAHTKVVGYAPLMHAVSTDGTRVIFESGGALYERENAEMEQSQLSPQGACLEPTMGCTVQVDASYTGGIGGGGRFIAATAQGTDIFFTDGGVKKLTGDTVPTSGQNLYEFDVETGKLTDLTPFAAAQVLSLLQVGLGEEGSAWHLYIVADGSFGEANAEGLQAQPNAPNLYEFSQGSPVTFVATLAPSDTKSWEEREGEPNAAASPNGRYLAFGSVAQVTGYDNRDASTGEPDSELFLYDSAVQRLVCVSCGAAGVRPSGATSIFPSEATTATSWAPGYLRRKVFNDGRVVFDTPNGLVSGDLNGRNDVYIYEGGQAHLISSGTSTEDSYFYEASGLNSLTGQESEDVFFATNQHLLGADTGNGPALYDARVAGGFLGGSGETVEGQSCKSAEACRSPFGEPPVEPFPASDALLAGGNLPALAVAPTGKPAVRGLTRAQKLARALKACHGRRNKKKRATCEKRAQRAYGRGK